MQSYLGEYPGSRSDSDKKFLRAVQSFIDQKNKNSELVISSDSCDITHNLYYKYYKENPRIKYVYVDKDTPNMYEGDSKYYRGLPREVARSIATGDIITYMDSDDFLLPGSTDLLINVWKNNKELDAIYNRSWYDNIKSLDYTSYCDEVRDNIKPVEIKGLQGKWYSVKLKNYKDGRLTILYTPWLVSHKTGLNIKWRDVVNEGTSEDVIFGKQIIKEYNYKVMEHPTYVRCHYSNRWDY